VGLFVQNIKLSHVLLFLFVFWRTIIIASKKKKQVLLKGNQEGTMPI
jgi:hypothetical protein